MVLFGRSVTFKTEKCGREAYKLHRVWRLGFHFFVIPEEAVLRFVFLRTREHTHYAELKIRNLVYENLCQSKETK
jgi:hypothetical protein